MKADPWDHTSWQLRRSRDSFFERLGVWLAISAFLGFVAVVASVLLGDSQPAKRRVTQVSLVIPTPQQPPPTAEVKPREPRVEQPKVIVEERTKMPEPERPRPREQPPTAQASSGLDFKGSGSGSPTDLVPTEGGDDGPAIGGGGADRARFGWFASAIESQLQEHLHKNEELRKSGYRITLRLWISRDGSIERYELLDSGGNSALERRLRTALDGMPRLEKPPPADMPQPVTLRITARTVNG